MALTAERKAIVSGFYHDFHKQGLDGDEIFGIVLPSLNQEEREYFKQYASGSA